MTRRIKIGGVLVAAVLGLLILSLAALPQGAQADKEVDTHAVVIGSGEAPIVNAKWELPDMDSYDEGIQYCASTPTDLNENEICDADDEPLIPGMQMYPNINNEPELRQIEFWLAAEDPDGLGDIAAAWSMVYHPDGTLKYKVELFPVDCSEIGYYDDSTTPETLILHEPLLAAIDTDQISREEAELLVKRCYKNEKLVFKGHEVLHHHQPAGDYLVEGHAQDWDSNEGVLPNLFTVMPIIYLDIDFDVVDWGTISAGITDWVSGDDVMGTCDKPTVKNGGNVPMGLQIHFTEMVSEPPHTITQFDAKLMGETLDLQASEWKEFTNKLLPCTPKQLDLSIHPPAQLPQGTYMGKLNLRGVMD
jgi:hypothetical protein